MSDSENISSPITFDGFGIDDRVRAALDEVGYETPSPIQAATIPPLMAGRDVVGLAQTGTGKTAAFAIPILSRLDVSAHKPQALVLAPTRELALQVAEAFGRYSSKMPEVKVLPIYGGQSYGIQLSGLRRGAQVIVGTPGRVIDHLDKGTLDLSELAFLVLDEADEMLSMGFAEDIERILADTPDDKQVALFSATMPSSIGRLARKYLNNPEEVKVKAQTSTASNITQRYLQVSHQRKLDALTRVLEVEDFDGMIVFVRTKSATEELAEKLRARGLSSAAINGDMVQAQRERTINQLKDGSLDILVATDVAARGLDVDRISHVVNYDIPHDTESYVHRIGRTGRAGRSGTALLFVSPRERHLLRAIERATRQELTEIDLPSVEDVNAQRVLKFGESITRNLESDNLDLFRGLVETYARDNDVAMADVAAALALETRDGGFLMAPDPPAGERRERPERRERTPKDGGRFAQYRIAVGRKHKVSPGAIVGAIANEGGLTRADFGNISIRDDFSIVELPDDLDNETLAMLKHTRIGKNPIDIRRDQGPPGQRGGRKSGGYGGGKSGGYKGGKKDHWGKRPPRVAGRGRD
ncbi:DEAD/DEAH box helicase [Gordonia sp. PP30]|uniref:DEAD/DEAH box helicase n=1 Tax=unclassified Gordonia (in: high G+C Gram-positive bacteria) TaxID=2657482 RepID=UPI001FFF8217|nr:DEAD/DEAH box helicase [Gordonia sp. PP30]UQE76404.1 DEAD/DEAH box helicase [Gordonia sp. PP30]